MVDYISTGLFKVPRLQWRLGGAWIDGGQSVFGESQARRTDGGGRWFCEADVILFDDDDARSYEAMLLNWNNGDDKVVVSRWGGPLMVSPNGATLVPHSDGTPFSDGSLYASGDVTAELVEPVARRATTMKVKVWGGRAFRGAEPFTLVGPLYGARLYGAAKIMSATPDGNATIYELRTSPPAREAYSAGLEPDFSDPRCTMRPNMQATEWPTYEPPFTARPKLVFAETFKP